MAQGVKTDPVTSDRVVAASRQGDSAKQIAKDLGLSVWTVYEIRKQRRGEWEMSPGIPQDVPAEPENASLKARILRSVVERGPFADVDALLKDFRRPDEGVGPHEVVHLLYSLNKQDAVQFKQLKSGNKQGQMLLVDIKPGRRGYAMAGIPVPGYDRQRRPNGARVPGTSRNRHAAGKDYTEQRYHGPSAVGGPIERSRAVGEPVAAPVQQRLAVGTRPVAQEWPLLEDLRARQRTQEADAMRVAAYLEAATALDKVDPVQANALLAKAEAITGKPLSPLEIEYLKYAEEHRG